jgi:hypothetical protein
MVAILFVLRVNLVSKFDMLESLSECKQVGKWGREGGEGKYICIYFKALLNNVYKSFG